MWGIGEASSLSLDEKLQQLDYKRFSRLEAERVMPFKAMEEKMLKFQRECELRYKNELESEIHRLKTYEVSQIRLEEGQKYRTKLVEYREELEGVHSQKLKDLKAREQE